MSSALIWKGGTRRANSAPRRSKRASLYQQAIDRDPGFAPAYAGMAFSNIFLCGRQLAPRQGMPKAKAAALRALQLDEGLAEAHAALGWVSLQYDWDWSA